jgi:amino acid adenylation domain-containing protein
MQVTDVELRSRRTASDANRALGPDGVLARSNLTSAQFLMWLGQQIDPDLPLYNMIQIFRIDGALDPETFDQAWQSVVRRSDALRMTVAVDAGAPMATVHDEMAVRVEIVDLTGASDVDAAGASWIEHRKLATLGLDDRLWDTALLKLGDERWIWYLCQHHLITDGQAFALTYEYVAEAYELATAGELDTAPALPQYCDYQAYERDFRSSPPGERAARHWASRIDEAIDRPVFYGRTAGDGSARTDRIVVDVDAERCARLRAIAGSPEFASLSEEMSMFAIWATVLFTALHRITGESAMRIGTPFLGRSTPDFRRTIGLFIEVGAIDLSVEPDDSLSTVAKRALHGLITGMRFAKPGACSAELNRSYGVLLNNVTSRFEPFAGFPVTTDWVHTGYGDRDHSVRLQISDFDSTGTVRLHFDVNAAVFGDRERQWLIDQFDAVLRQFTADPAQSVGGFDLLTVEERQRQIDEFNDTDADYPRDLTVVDLFNAQVQATPDSIAAVDGAAMISYAELDDRSTRLAHVLQQHGVAAGSIVAIGADRSIDAVAAILAVLKSGGAYAPIDTSYPAQRQQYMIDDANPVVVLTAGTGLTIETTVPTLDVAAIDLGAQSADAVLTERRPDGIAYMIYTSGSTGRPKGTMLSHGGLVNYLWWARQQYQNGETLDFPLYSSLSFDLTITSLFVPLISGGRIVIYGCSRFGDGLEILDVFADDAVDIVKLTPAHLMLLCEHGADSTRIQRLIVGGENFRTSLANDVIELFDHDVVIFNEYGPTEAVVGCMIHRFDPVVDTGPSVPIGRPAANARIHVLDRYDHPVPGGVVGEIVVSSDGVALGYRNLPELTAERFDDDPMRRGARRYRTGDLARWGVDGRLEFLGRDDHQVKIRGARIELGEIETAVLEHPDIDAAVVDVIAFEDEVSGAVGHCRTCGLPSNYPGSDFDETGECSDCRAYERYSDQVARYFRTPDQLRDVVSGVKGRAADRPHDCVVLVSGGKDSTYMLYQLVREFGVRPLVFTLDNGYISDAALGNVRNACADLGVDLHVGSTPHMNEIFVDSLERHCNVCDGCFKTIYTLSMSLARERGIDTIITGLARGQLFETRLADTFAAREFDPDAIDSLIMDARKAYHHIDDAVFQLLETDLFDDETLFDDIRLVDFYRFVDVDLDEVFRYLTDETVWQRPTDTGRSTNCLINDVGIFVHKKQRGYHNYALPYGWDVRLGHKRREAAMDELDDDIDLERVRHILDEIGYDRPLADARSDKRLAAYYVSKTGVTSSELRAYLELTMPTYMVPSYLVELPELPLTIGGKIDRAALPDPGLARPDLATTYVAPSSDTEQRLAEIWSDVFRLPDIGVHDNFFDLGGDSIMSIQIVAQARRAGMQLSARDIFTQHTVANLAAALDADVDVDVEHVVSGADAQGGDDRSWPDLSDEVLGIVAAQLSETGRPTEAVPTSVEDIYPLTSIQLGMLYHCLRSPDSLAYQGHGTCTFAGEIDVEHFRSAWSAVCDRHPATRTRFVWSGLDEPVQVVQRDLEFPWETHDWSGLPADESRELLDKLLHRYATDVVDPSDAAMMSFAFVRLEAQSVFVWNAHHAVLDGWSAELLFSEVIDDYVARRDGHAPAADGPRPFRDHVRWLEMQDHPTATSWWRDHLVGIDASTPLTFPPVIGIDTGRGEVTRTIDASRSTAIADFAREQRVTLSTLAGSAWGVLLSHYSGEPDVLFGTTVSGREDGLDSVEAMIGVLLATLPTRVTVAPGSSVADLLATVQRNSIEARRHGHVGLADIQRLTTISTAQPLFDSIVVIENYPHLDAGQYPELGMSDLGLVAHSNYTIALLLHPGDELRLELVYERSAVPADLATRILEHFEQTLTSLAEGANRPLRDVVVIGEDEREVLAGFGCGETVSPEYRLLHELVATHASTGEAAVAVRSDGAELTYSELDRRANQIAHGLRGRGIGRGSHVGVVVGNHPHLIAGVLGILKSGAVYVPIDPELPHGRRAHMIEETEMSVLLDAGDAPNDIDDAICVDITTFGVGLSGQTPPDDGPVASDPAYVVYTSGSTGTPKGVVITHANITHSTAVRSVVYPEQPTVFLLLSSLAFDSSMVGLFWTLCAGGMLVVPSAERRRNLRYLASAVAEHGVTHLLALPSVYGLLLEESEPGQLRSLRVVIVAGEACPTSLSSTHHAQCAHSALYNEYGPTEGTVWSHVHRVLTDGDLVGVPIGRPIPNSVCRVVDHLGQFAPIGLPGELLLGGPGISAGYLHRDDLTAEKFVSLPDGPGRDGRERFYRTGDLVRWRPDGLLDFLGRIDHQVKIRGHRVELTEIDDVLLDHGGVTAAATVLFQDVAPAAQRSRLVACYSGTDTIDEGVWRTALAERLPGYMVPASFLRLDSLPVTSTGKIDRPALMTSIAAQQRTDRDVGERELDPLEATLLPIWAGVLGRDDIRVEDDFFDLGGNSIDAMKLFARIEKHAGREIPLSALFDAPTISGLARILADAPSESGNSSLVAIKPGGFKRAFFYVGPYEISVLELSKISKYFDADRPFYGLQSSGLQVGETIHRRVEDMAAHYIEAIKQQQPRGPYLIGGHCDGCWVAHEMAVQLADRGETVSYLGLVDLSPPPEDVPSTGRVERVIERIRHYGSDGRLGNAIRWQLKLKLENEVLLRFGSAASRRVRQVRIAHREAFGRYQIEHDHRAPVHLVRSSELADLMDEIRWYDRLDSGENTLVVTDIQSTHARLLLEPETEELANVLSAEMARAEVPR